MFLERAETRFRQSPQRVLFKILILDRQGPIVIGTGGSGHGFKFSPLLGEVLADLAEGRDPGLPPGKLSLSRFEPAADVAG